MEKNQNVYDEIERFVASGLKKAGKEHVLLHSRRTVFWLLELKPDADEALKIAALAHDIERISLAPPLEGMVAGSTEGWMDPAFLNRHSTKGAEIIAEFMNGLEVAPEMIERVKFLVAGHEFSGTNDQNVLKDADSVSFFENNIEVFLDLKVKLFGKEKVRDKIEWMYSRITSETARRIAAPWYHRAMMQLDVGGTKSV